MEAPDESLNDLLLIKSRIIEHIIGNETGGELWRNAVIWGDKHSQAILDTPFQPERWENPKDDQIPNRLAKRAQDLRTLAESYANPSSQFYHQKTVFNRIEEELRNILEHFNPDTPRVGNWYYWLLATPNHLGVIGLLLENDLPTDLLEQLRSSLHHELQDLRLDGSNAAQEARNHVYLALLDKDTARIERAAAHALKTLTYSTDFGIREDYSYLFHGHIPYAGGYGADFARDAAQFLFYFNGTHWAVTPEKREIFVNYLLEHVRWFIVGEMQDLNVSGRGYHSSRNINNWFTGMLLMTQVDNSRQAELESTVAAILNRGFLPSPELAVIAAKVDRSKGKDLSGFRFWYAAEMGVYKSDRFHISFRQFSERVQDYEYLTLIGGDGWNLAYGFTNILRKGNEWYQCENGQLCQDIDMVHLPGTTARIGAEPTNPLTHIGDTGFSLNWGTSPFSGGAGWAEGGVAGFILEPAYGDFSAKKSLHFFPQGFWAIGTHIQSNPNSKFSDFPIHTTLLQWVSCKPLVLSDKRILSPHPSYEETTFSEVRWFHLDGIGGVFEKPTTIHVRRRDSIVTIWIDHGNEVTNGSYAYAILPASTLEETRAFAKEKPVRPIPSEANIHSVHDETRNAESIVFFEPGTCRGDIQTDQPLILYRKQTNSGSVITLQNPLHNGRTIHINSKLEAEPTFADPEIQMVPDDKNGTLQMTLRPTLGRIYRAGFGSDGMQVHSTPHEDLSSFHQFSVQEESTPEKTIFTVKLPQEAIDSGYQLSLRGYKGHFIKQFNETDIVDRPEPNTIRYLWNRPPPPDIPMDSMGQVSGDFRFYLETPLCIAITYITIPPFDREGKIDLQQVVPIDRNNPKRSIRK